MSSIDRASCHGSRDRATPAKTTASTTALRTMTTLRLYLSAQAPHSGTSGAPTTKISALNSPTNASRSVVLDAHLAQVRRQQGEDLADAEPLDHRGDPEDRHDDPPVLRRAGTGRDGASGGRAGIGHPRKPSRWDGRRAPGAPGARSRRRDARRRTRKRPKELVRHRPFDGSRGFEQVRSPWSPPGPSLAGLATSEPGSRDRPEDHSSNRSGGSHLPLRARRNVRPGPRPPQGACPRTCAQAGRSYPRTSHAMWTTLWIHSPGRCRDGSLLARIIAAQDRWARPFGDFNHRWLQRALPPDPPDPGPAQRRLARPPAPRAPSTDIPIGTLLLAVVLDLLDQPAAADVALVGHDPVHAGGRRDRRRRLRRHGRHRPGPGDAPLDADGRRARWSSWSRSALRAGDPADRTIPVVLVDHRVR